MRRMSTIAAGLLLLSVAAASLSRAQDVALVPDAASAPAGPATQPSTGHDLTRHAGSEEKPRKAKAEAAAARRDSAVFETPTVGTHDAAALTDVQIHDLIMIVMDVDLERGKRLEAGMKDNPERTRQLLSPLVGRLLQLKETKKHSPDTYKLKVDDFRLNMVTQDLASQYHQAILAGDKTKAEGLKSQLHNKLMEHFALRQKIQERELEVLEKRIAEMRNQIAARKDSENQLVDERFEQLTTKATKPEW